MLEGLDEVDWSRLSHAYGDAGDIPRRIRALLSKNAEARDRAVHELFSSICHQGTVYSVGQQHSFSNEFIIEDEALRSAVAEALRRIEGDLGGVG